MMFDLQLESSCKEPEEGDVFISEQTWWPSVGYFTLVFSDPRVLEGSKLRTIPFQFAQSLCIKEFIGKISLSSPPEYIMPIGKVTLK